MMADIVRRDFPILCGGVSSLPAGLDRGRVIEEVRMVKLWPTKQNIQESTAASS